VRYSVDISESKEDRMYETVNSNEEMMAQSSKKPISPAEGRQWLEQLERGQGITQISKSAGRDIRIVKRHIEMAREEKQLAQARHDFILQRIQQHQGDLLGVVRTLRTRLSGEVPLLPQPTDPIEARLNQALREHVRSLPLKGLLESYQRDAEAYLKIRQEVEAQLAEEEEKVLQKLGLEVQPFPWTSDIVRDFEKRLWRENVEPVTYGNHDAGGPAERKARHVVTWGGLRLIRLAVDEATAGRIQEAHCRLVTLGEEPLEGLRGTAERLKQNRDRPIYELDTLLLKGMVPGRCALCP
jgi:DNA-directed RNA polymerase subunit H (RpoH/RPB5)